MKTNLPFPNRLSNIAALISKLSLLIFAGIFCFGDSVFAGIKPVYNVKATHINNTAAIRVKQSGLLGGSDQAGYKNNYYNYLFISGASVDKGFRHIMQNWEILAGWGDNYVLKGNNLGSDKPATGFSKSIFTNPVISTTGTLSALTTTYGTASASSSFNVSGTSMTAGILVTPPSRFEVSKDNATFSSTVTIGAAGIIASTPVYIRLIGSVNAGSYSGNVVLSSTGASSINEPTAPSTVNKAPLTITANNEVDTYGQAIPALTITSSGFVNGDNTASLTTLPTASVMATAASPAGSYAITASGAVDPNYTITYAAGTLTISKAPLTVTADNQTINLGQPIPTLTATYNGFVNGDNSASLTSLATVNTTANSSSPVGSYPIMASGAVDPNYTISYVAGTLKINPALPVLTITANNQSSVYAQAIPALTITYSGFVNGDNTTSLTTLATASTMATAASPAGSYAITASGAVDPNYNIKYVQGSLTINKAPLTVTADNQTMNLGQAIPALTVSYNGFVNGDNSVSLTTAATAATTATPSSPIGNYPITVSGAVDPNYTISYVAGTLKINPALPVLTITANNQSSVYAQAIPALTITYSGFVNGDNTASLTTLATASTMATAASPAGSYAITASGAVDPNYNIKYVQGSLTISKAPLTVTADNQTMNPGQAIPALTVSYNGFVNGDNSASLTTAATAATTATSSSPIGNYPITASGAVDPNYTISYVAGTLNIAGVPALSYSSPQTYTAGTAIASLAPTSNSVAAPGYNNSPVTLGFGLNNPTAVAVDAAGNVYIADANNNAVKKIAVGGFPVTIATISDPHGIAVDAAGNVYVDSYATNGVVYKIPVGGGSPITWATGFADAGGIAVDGAGKVYVAATGNGGLKVIPAGGGSWAFLSYSFNAPTSVAVDAPGNVYLAVSGQNVIDEIPVNGGQPIQLATLANPTGVAVDAAGNVYATSHGTNALYQIPAGGGTPVLVSDAFNNPMGIAVDGAGNVYVVDAGIASIDKIVPVGGYFITPALPAGLSFNETTGAISGTPLVGSPAKTYTVTAYNSSGGGSTTLSIQVNLPLLPTVAYSNPHAYLVQAAITPLAPVSGGVAAPLYSRSTVTLGSGFVNPYDVALDAAGDLFIVQQSSGTVTEIPAGNGTPVQLGSGLGPSNGVAVDAAGNVYVASFSSNAVYKIPAGNGTPVAIGSGFSGPTGVAVDVLGNVYVADFNNNAVKEIPVGGGAPFAIGSGFSIPNGVAVDVSGNVYVADSGNGSVKKIPVGGGSPIVLGTGIIDPYSVAVDAVGNVYVADRNADAIEEIMAGGNTTVTLGSGFNQPYGVAVDGIGNVYVADYYNNAVKKIKPVGGYYLSSVLPAGLSFSNSTGIISGTPTKSSPATNYIVTAYNSGGSSTTAVNIKINALTISYASPQTYLVGTAIPALTPTTIGGVTAPAYSGSVITLGSGFSTPTGVAVDVSGNVYIADAGNNLIKKIPVGGGAPVAIGSGFSHPEGVAVDASGNVYVADYNNNAVKEIPVAGGSPVTLGSGFVTPTGVAVDAAGNVYVADYGNNAVKEIPQGIGAPVTLGSGFSSPTGVAVDGAGNIYVADYGNRLVKEIPAGSTTPVTLGSGFSTPFGLTVDAAGNVFVADFGGGAVKEIAAGSTTPVSIGPAFGGPTGVATDEAGNVYVADFSASLIKEIKPIGGYYIGPLLPAGVAFSNATGAISGTPTVGSPATNYTVTAYNGSGNNSTTVSIKVNALTISYPTPKNYLADITISAFPPTSSGVAAAAYSNSTVFFGSGFSGPTGVAVDKSGNIFVADPIKNVVTKFPVGGGAPVNIGSGFNGPFGVAVDGLGNVYVADQGHSQIKKIPLGTGTPVAIGNGFNEPTGVAVDAAGNVYVADYENNQVEVIPGNGGGQFTLASGFSLLVGIALDAAGNVYVADRGDNLVSMIPAGGGTPVVLGSGFSSPYGVAVDAGGNVYVADNFNGAVKEIPAGSNTPIAIGPAFGNPEGVALDGAGNVYVADFTKKAVFEIKPVGGYYIGPNLPVGLKFDDKTGILSGKPLVTSQSTNYTITAYNGAGSNSALLNITIGLPPVPTISYATPKVYTAGTTIPVLIPVSSTIAAPGYSSTATGFATGFDSPASIASDSKGNIYIADPAANAVEMVPAGGGITTIIGSGFSAPSGVAVDASGNVYVADFGNNAIKEIPVGNGTPVTLGSGFVTPSGVAVDATGNIYVADYGNNAVKEIPMGTTTPITLGSGFSHPTGLTVDGGGNIYIADFGNNKVKEILAGSATPIIIGSGFNQAYNVAVDPEGDLFIADFGNGAIKEIPAGSSTIIKIGPPFNSPEAVAIDGAGNIYVGSFGYSVVQQITPVGGYFISANLPAGLSFAEATGIISGKPTVASPATNYIVTAYNVAGGNHTTVNITVNMPALPTISYVGPQSYIENTAITALSPTSTGVAAPAYGNTSTSIGSGFITPVGVAVDAAGNIYVADPANNAVEKIPVGGGAPITIGTGFSSPSGVAVDASGNVYVADNGNNVVKKIANAGGATTIVASGFNGPYDVALDAAGNIYVADSGNKMIEKIPAGSSTPVTVGTGFGFPQSVAVDVQGNIYVADSFNNAIYEIPAGGGATFPVGSGYSSPFGVAVDQAGNVFVSDAGHSKVQEIPVGGSQVSIGSGFSLPYKIAFDGAGNVYVADAGNSVIKKTKPIGGYYIGPILPAGLSFSQTTGVISGKPTVVSPATIYTITAYNFGGGKAAALNIKVVAPDVNLSNLVISGVSFLPAFAAATTVYTASVPYTTSSITVTPTVADATTTVTVNGTAVTSGTASASIALAIGPNVITTKVTAHDGVTTKSYTVTITRAAASTNALFTSVTLSPALTLVGTTGTAYLNFTAAAANTITSVQVIPTAKDPTATITVNGVAVTSGMASASIPLVVGTNVITTVITAQDGMTTKNCIITITRAQSSNDGLAALALSNGTLTPTFATATLAYTASVANTVTSITVTPTTSDATATVTVNGTAVTSGTASGSIPLVVGPNTITAKVTAQNSTSKTYTVTVTRAVSSNATLSNLTVSSGAILPVFVSGTTGYTASVPYATTSVTMTPTTSDANATVTVNGSTVMSGAASASIPLTVGANVITAKVTAQDGVTTKTYGVTITRVGPSTNALFTSIALSPALSLVGTTGTAYLNFTAAAANTITSIQVIPTAKDPTATITVNGVAVTSGMASASIPLAIGSNVITTVITAQDGVTTKNCIITITRAQSSNDNLASLVLSSGILAPTFAAGTTSYTQNVPNTTTTVTVTPTTSDATATVTVNGTIITSGTASQAIPLIVGVNTITTKVTAQTNATKTYTVAITRAVSANANLSNLSVSGLTIAPVFATGTTGYTASVPYTTTSITMTPTTSDPTATVTVNGTTVMSGTASVSIPLTVGTNVITAKVTAQDGVTTKTYGVTITRTGPSTNALIASISLTPVSTLVGTTGTGYLNFSSAVPNTETSVQVIPTAKDATATITVNGMAATSGMASQAIALNVGANVITTVLTAQDGVTTKTVIITVNRAMPAVNNLYEPISVTKPADNVTIENDGVIVHQAVSPNGDGINDYLTIDNIANYPDNRLTIMNRSGVLVFEAKGYDNSSKVFDGHSNKNGAMQLPGTYFYSLDYTVNGQNKHHTGFIILKY